MTRMPTCMPYKLPAVQSCVYVQHDCVHALQAAIQVKAPALLGDAAAAAVAAAPDDDNNDDTSQMLSVAAQWDERLDILNAVNKEALANSRIASLSSWGAVAVGAVSVMWLMLGHSVRGGALPVILCWSFLECITATVQERKFVRAADAVCGTQYEWLHKKCNMP
jgi:hypothetical protein